MLTATLARHHFCCFHLHFYAAWLVHQTMRMSKDKATSRFEEYYPHDFKLAVYLSDATLTKNAMKNQLALLALASLLLLDALYYGAPRVTPKAPVPVSPAVAPVPPIVLKQTDWNSLTGLDG